MNVFIRKHTKKVQERRMMEKIGLKQNGNNSMDNSFTGLIRFIANAKGISQAI